MRKQSWVVVRGTSSLRHVTIRWLSDSQNTANLRQRNALASEAQVAHWVGADLGDDLRQRQLGEILVLAVVDDAEPAEHFYVVAKVLEAGLATNAIRIHDMQAMALVHRLVGIGRYGAFTDKDVFDRAWRRAITGLDNLGNRWNGPLDLATGHAVVQAPLRVAVDLQDAVAVAHKVEEVLVEVVQLEAAMTIHFSQAELRVAGLIVEKAA